MELSSKQIKEIAEANDVAHDVIVNSKTKEFIELPNILNGPIFEYNEYHTEDLEKLEMKWNEFKKFESPNSSESFSIMASFIENLSQSEIKDQLIYALEKKNPFSNFNQIIHNSEIKQDWYNHKSDKLEERVRNFIQEIKITST